MVQSLIGGNKTESKDDFINLGMVDPHRENKLMKIEIHTALKSAQDQGAGTPFNRPAFIKDYRAWKDHLLEAQKKGFRPKFDKPQWKDYIGKHLFNHLGNKEIPNTTNHTLETQYNYVSLDGRHRITVCVVESKEDYKERKDQERESNRSQPKQVKAPTQSGTTQGKS